MGVSNFRTAGGNWWQCGLLRTVTSAGDSGDAQDNATKEFADWIQETYPQVWKAYLKKVAP